MFWGITPALDLIYEYKYEFNQTPEELNILLIGGADSRHVIKTIAKRYKHKKVKLNFYLLEGCCETIAKQLLLLNVALQPTEALGLLPKTRIFMELYGNTLIRPMVAKYLTATAAELVEMVTNYEYMKSMMSCVDLDIKYKERDYIENLMKFWCSQDDYDISLAWDNRLRQTLGERYDSRKGVFDWDLHMRMHSVGGSQICSQEYQTFRMNGVAFNWMEAEVTKTNRSMVCIIVPNGEKFYHYGYLGDMLTGPFVTFGIECDDDKYLKSVHGDNFYRATDVTERNLCQIFHELEFNEQYVHQTTNDVKMGQVTMVISMNKLTDTKASDRGRNKISKCLDLDDVKVKFLSLSSVELMKYRNEYKKLFDIIYFGNSYVKYITKELFENACNEKCLIMVENQKFVMNIRDPELKKRHEDLKEQLKVIDLKHRYFEPSKSNFAKFVYSLELIRENALKKEPNAIEEKQDDNSEKKRESNSINEGESNKNENEKSSNIKSEIINNIENKIENTNEEILIDGKVKNISGQEIIDRDFEEKDKNTEKADMDNKGHAIEDASEKVDLMEKEIEELTIIQNEEN